MAEIVGLSGSEVVGGKGNEAFANKLRDLLAMNERGELASLGLLAVDDKGEAFCWTSFSRAQRHVFNSTLTMLQASVVSDVYLMGEDVPRI